MTGYEYEEKCAKLLKAKGFTDVKVTPGSGDQGIDVLAIKNGKRYGIQCKYYEGTVGNKAVQEAFAGASFYDCAVAMVITNSQLTAPARKLAAKLSVEVWEGVDAIYLRQNDAEYLKQEEVRKKKEAEARKQQEQDRLQRELLAFQQWQTKYKEWQTQILVETEPLEKRYTEKKDSLISQRDKRCEELADRISVLRMEQKRMKLKMEAASLFQFSIKTQSKKRITEIDTEIMNITQELAAIKAACESKLTTLEQEHHSNLAKIRQKIEEQVQLSSCPKSVESAKISLVLDRVLAAEEKLMTSYQRENEKFNQLILMKLCSGGKMTISELRKQIPELKDYNDRFVWDRIKQLEKNGSVLLEEYPIRGPLVSVADSSMFHELEKWAFDTITKYTKEEIILAIKNDKIGNSSNVSYKALKEEILACLAYGSEYTIAEIIKATPALQSINESKVSVVCRQLKKTGEVASKERGGRIYYSLY